MKRLLSAILLALVLATTSCHGQFAAFNSVQKWNGGLGDKWVNSIVHFAMWVVPAYELILLGDLVIFNTLEFWTGDNPLAANISGDPDRVLVQVEDRTYELRATGAESVSVWRDGDHLGVATRTDGGWAWQDESNRRTLLVADAEARRLAAALQ